MNFPNPFYRWRPHPWHGLEVGKNAPSSNNAFIEVTSFDAIKSEDDKLTGYMRVDSTYQSSSMPPSVYGFIPRTHCGVRTGALSDNTEVDDGDPLDICMLSERPIDRSEFMLSTHVISGRHMFDRGEADD